MIFGIAALKANNAGELGKGPMPSWSNRGPFRPFFQDGIELEGDLLRGQGLIDRGKFSGHRRMADQMYDAGLDRVLGKWPR